MSESDRPQIERALRFIADHLEVAAALRLAYEPDRSVTEIGQSCGYSSTSNFTKAFTAFFGVSPSRLRNPDPNLPVQLGKLVACLAR